MHHSDPKNDAQNEQQINMKMSPTLCQTMCWGPTGIEMKSMIADFQPTHPLQPELARVSHSQLKPAS